jgi:hypothetical protein
MRATPSVGQSPERPLARRAEPVDFDRDFVEEGFRLYEG